MSSTKKNNHLKETIKVIEKIRKLTSKLNESEKATLELVLDKEAMIGLKNSLKEAKKGKTVPLGKLRT